VLTGVAATSPTNAWAVGRQNGGPGRTLIEHWDGRHWTVQAGAKLGGLSASELSGVVATSAHDAWAVGDFHSGTRTLIEHWNGRTWRLQTGSYLGKLFGVAATSSTNAWAVGTRYKLGPHTLIEHWDGRTWKIEPSPNPYGNGGSQLFGVTATAGVWAVGEQDIGLTANNHVVIVNLVQHCG
jgi:hypothetical protein